MSAKQYHDYTALLEKMAADSGLDIEELRNLTSKYGENADLIGSYDDDDDMSDEEDYSDYDSSEHPVEASSSVSVNDAPASSKSADASKEGDFYSTFAKNLKKKNLNSKPPVKSASAIPTTSTPKATTPIPSVEKKVAESKSPKQSVKEQSTPTAAAAIPTPVNAVPAAPTLSSEDLSVKAREAGNEYYTAQNYYKAISSYSEALDLTTHKPTQSSILTNRAAAYMMVENYADCAADCVRAIQLNPENAKAFSRGARAEVYRGEYQSAIRLFNGALNLTPDSKELNSERSASQVANQNSSALREAINSCDWENAAHLVKKLLKISPAATFLKLAEIQVNVGLRKYADANAIAHELMIKTDKKDPSVLATYAMAQHYSGATKRAEALVMEALRIDPELQMSAKLRRTIKRVEDLKNKGNEAFKTSKWDEAIEFYTSALDVDMKNVHYNARLYCNRSQVYLKQQNLGEAFDDANLAVECDATWPKGYIRRATVGVAFGDTEHLEGALRDYKKAEELVGDSDDVMLSEIKIGIKTTKKLLKESRKKNYYKILDVQKGCTEDELKKAYRKAALKWHPDRHSSSDDQSRIQAEAMFKSVSEAYEILNDPVNRRKYDQGMVSDGSGGMMWPEEDSDDEGHHSRRRRGGHGHGMPPGFAYGFGGPQGFPGFF